MIIAIDGPSGTGKSTVAKAIAKRLGFTFFDTGAMYRSMAWWIAKLGISPEDESAIQKHLSSFAYEIRSDSEGARRYFVNGTEVTTEIRSQEISSFASKIAKYPEVRKFLVQIQRQFGASQDAVFEGRDMGTVVFPTADLKIFLTAKPEVRAERRYRELLAKFPELATSLSREQILKEIKERDLSDTTRTVSPLKQASDAILIDTTDLSAVKVVEKIVKIFLGQKKNRSRMRLFYGCVYWISRFYFKVFYRLKIYGLSHYRPGAAILAANHASYLDPPVVSISCPEEVHFLAKESLFRVPLLSNLIRRLNSHPVARDASDLTTFKMVLDLLHRGGKVILFPEGKRTPDGTLQSIERGLAFLTAKARCRIQPIYVAGTFDAWPIAKKLPSFSGKIAVIFGTPIEWASFEGMEKKQAERLITEKMGEALRDLRQWYEAGAIGEPP
jgi:cytidylate kinase